MSISLVSNTQALSSTLTPGTHAAGDLLMAYAANDGASIAPTLPSGWINLASVGNSLIGARIAYKYAQSSSETFGTWTNADHVSLTVWRGAANTVVVPWQGSTNGGTSTGMQWLAQVGQFRDNAEDTALIAYGHNRNSSNNLAQTLGALSNLFEDGDGVNFQVCAKYQLARTTAFANTTLTMATSVAWRTYVFCLNEQTVYGISGGGGGLILPIGFQGGL